jgi:hypothetical protein
MKQALSTFIILLFFITSTTAQEQGSDSRWKKRYEQFKERNISKTYSASGNTLYIDNQFGDVTVITGGNEIKVDIHIEASSNQKEVAEKIFDQIEVEESKNGSEIKFRTTFSKNNNVSCKNCSNTMQINYTVRIPANTPLKIENQFGNITIPDYIGTLSIESKFCQITAGVLSKVEKLNVEFGNKAYFKGLNAINATFKFAPVTIESLSGNSTIKMEFCNESRIMLDNNLSSLTLNQSYGSLNIRPASNLSASYRIRTSFGSFRDRSNANIQRTDKPDEYGPDSERTYEGKSGSGAAKIEIKSSFGKIIIGEATAEEMEDKKKSKAKAEI